MSEPAAPRVYPARERVVEIETARDFAAELNANGMLIGQVVTVATDARSPSIVKIGEDRFQIFYRRDTSIESRVISGSAAQPPRRRAVR